MQLVLKAEPEDFSYVTVGWVARELGVSVPNLSRSFKKNFKMTFQYFLILKKMLTAFTLMGEGKYKTVKELADALDYNSTSQFIAAFKKYVGRTPGEMLRCPEKRWRVAIMIMIMLQEYRKFNRRPRKTPAASGSSKKN